MKTLARNAFISLFLFGIFSTWAHARPGYVKVQLEQTPGSRAGGPPAEVLARLEKLTHWRSGSNEVVTKSFSEWIRVMECCLR